MSARGARWCWSRARGGPSQPARERRRGAFFFFLFLMGRPGDAPWRADRTPRRRRAAWPAALEGGPGRRSPRRRPRALLELFVRSQPPGPATPRGGLDSCAPAARYRLGRGVGGRGRPAPEAVRWRPRTSAEVCATRRVPRGKTPKGLSPTPRDWWRRRGETRPPAQDPRRGAEQARGACSARVEERRAEADRDLAGAWRWSRVALQLARRDTGSSLALEDSGGDGRGSRASRSCSDERSARPAGVARAHGGRRSR